MMAVDIASYHHRNCPSHCGTQSNVVVVFIRWLTTTRWDHNTQHKHTTNTITMVVELPTPPPSGCVDLMNPRHLRGGRPFLCNVPRTMSKDFNRFIKFKYLSTSVFNRIWARHVIHCCWLQPTRYKLAIHTKEHEFNPSILLTALPQLRVWAGMKNSCPVGFLR